MNFNEKSILRTLKDGTCLSCGACKLACKFNAIKCSIDNEPQILKDKCTQCGMCQKVCVGNEFNFLRSYKEFHNEEFNKDNLLGNYKEAFLSYASFDDARQNGTSGGFIRAFLASLLENKKISGVVLVGSDTEEIWKAKGLYVKSTNELLNAQKSHYEKSFLLSCLKEIQNEDGKVAIVGLPCQIQAIHKLKEVFPFLKEKILLTIGLFCHSQIEVGPKRYGFSLIKEDKENIVEYTSRLGKHPGTPCVKLKDGKILPFYFSNLYKKLSKIFPSKKFFILSSHDILNLFYLFFTPERCKFCFDGASLLADISVGDPWIKGKKDIDLKKGYSFVVVRSEIAKTLVDFVKEKGKIETVNLKEEEIKGCNKKMLKHKFKNAIYFLRKERKVDYNGFESIDYKFSLKEKFYFCFSRKMFYLFRNKVTRKIFLKFLFSIFGYFLIYLNSKRKRLIK